MFSGANAGFPRVILSAPALIALSIMSTAQAAEFEPRYWWSPSPSGGRYASPAEAFLAHKAWEDANNETRGGTDYDITVIGYESNTGYSNNCRDFSYRLFRSLEHQFGGH